MTRILVTGSAGWIGIELCRRLEERGFEVWRFDRLVHARYQPNDSRMVYGDVTNLDSCRRVMREALPEILVHLAAIATTDKWMYDHPEIMTDVTYKGTMNIGNAFGDWAKETHSHPKQFIYASSSEIYGNAENPPFTEETEVRPCNVYAVAKYASELYLKEFFSKSYGIPYTILRNFNTYANLGYQRTLVDCCVKDMLTNQPVRLGHPDMVRDWEFRDDHVNAYLTVIGNEKAYNDVFNFCTGKPYTIRETAEIIAEETGFKGQILTGGVHPRPNDVPRLHGSNEKARRVLGWEPEYDFPHGVRKYVEEMRGRIKN